MKCIPTIKALQTRTQGISSIFDQMWTSLQSSFPGIINFFNQLKTRDLGLADIPKSEPVDKAIIDAMVQRITELGPKKVQVPATISPSGMPGPADITVRGALTSDQVSTLTQKLQKNVTTWSELISTIGIVDKEIQSNIDTQKGWLFFRTIDVNRALSERLNFLDEMVLGKTPLGKEFTSGRKAEEDRLLKVQRINEENQKRRSNGAPAIQVPGFPAAPFKPLPLDTSKFDTAIDKMVAAFNGENNNITQLSTAVNSLGTVTNSLKAAIEELRRTIPDGKVAVNIDQKSSVTVDIPDGVDIRSSSMRLDNRDAETLANSIGDALGRSIGTFFNFSGQG
jgi:hypothetical protein